MSINNVTLNSLQGMQAGMNRIAVAGSRINMDINDNSRVAANVVDQVSSAHHVKMSANVIKAADEMLGTLIDTHA